MKNMIHELEIAKELNFYEVLLPFHWSKLYTYKSHSQVDIGTLVEVNAVDKIQLGVIVKRLKVPQYKNSIKEIHLFTPYKLHHSIISWIFLSSEYTLIPKGIIFKNVISGFFAYKTAISTHLLREKHLVTTESVLKDMDLVSLKKNLEKNKLQSVDEIEFRHKLLPMNAEQKSAYQALSRTKKITVLQGPTGSGKSYVYLQIVIDALYNKKQVLILLPEIALTQEFSNNISRILGIESMIWNHTTHKAIKKSIWHWAISGRAGLLIGSRSAIWLPFNNLACIIIDEEHDSSYKQEQQIIYHAVSIALLRAKCQEIKCILVSATPSLEACYNMINGKYAQVKLSKQQDIDIQYAQIESQHWLSRLLYQKIKDTLAFKKQVMLFINKRGFSSKVLCTSCMKYLTCSRCSSYVIFHKNHYTRCPTCNLRQPLNRCIICANNQTQQEWKLYGIGIEKIEEQLLKLFPDARIVVVSSDTQNLHEVVRKIHDREFDIIIATQIISKGYNFAHLSTIGILQASHFSSYDPRHGEKIYQLIEQVKGRCARYGTTGQVVIQGEEKNKIIQAILNNDFDFWIKKELEIRRSFDLPPFVKLIKIVITSYIQEQARQAADALYEKLKTFTCMTTYPPTEASILKIMFQFRYFIIIKHSTILNAQKNIKQTLDNFYRLYNCKIVVDVDPHSFL